VTRFAWTAGSDWGGAAHHLWLMDARGEMRGRRVVDHTAAAVSDAMTWMRQVTGVPVDQIAVAIETPRGVLVDTLIEQGFAVFAINPKQLERFRDRFSMAGAKDDPRDARVLADALRTDPRAFRRVHPDDPAIIRLRELCRITEELQEEEGRLVNRLREQLYRVNAAWLALCPAADEPWLWTVLGAVPHPDAWADLPRRRITPVLRAHRIRRVSVDDVVTALQQPRLHAAAGVADAVAMRLTALLPQLTLVHAQRARTEREIEFSAPCQASEESSPPRCSLKRQAHWPSVIILRCAPRAGLHRSPSAAANGRSTCTCATPVRLGCGKRSSIGRVPASKMTLQRGSTTMRCAAAAITMLVPYVASRIAGCEF
jgi:Transposase